MSAYVAPEMLINVEPGEIANEAYRRMESAVLHNPEYYTTTTTFSFSSDLVDFYAKLEKGKLNIAELAL